MKDWKFLYQKYVLGKHNGWRQKYEPDVKKALKKIHGDLFVDIGANALVYSNLLAKNFCQVIAFEPNQNLPRKHPSNVRVLPLAISNFNGTAQFYHYEGGGADSLNKDFDYHVEDRGWTIGQQGPFKRTGESTVTVSTYDDAIQTRADLVKIDVEGSEFDVLDGMKKNIPRRMLVEVHDNRRENELLVRLKRMGFESFKKIDSNHWLAE